MVRFAEPPNPLAEQNAEPSIPAKTSGVATDTALSSAGADQEGLQNEDGEKLPNTGQTSPTERIPSLDPAGDPALQPTVISTSLPSSNTGGQHVTVPGSRPRSTPLPEAQPFTPSRTRDNVRQAASVDEGSAFTPRRTADSFFNIMPDSDHVLPVTEPRHSIEENPTLENLKERFSNEEWEKRFTRELSRLDRHHGPDLKSSMLSALFTTLPVLALYYIRSLPFRLLAVILFTLVFAVGLSLTYRPKRGEVFATIAA